MDHEQTTEVKKKGKGKIILALLLTLILAAGAGTGFYFVWQGANYIVTDNARVTTTLIAIMPTVPGRLERFSIYEGRYVEENEILGWVENSEAMRSPVKGVVLHTNAVQDQVVSPMEPVAIIADTSRIHIQANIEETDIAKIQVGQPAIVTIDTFGSQQFRGYVSEIGLITQAELTGNAMFFTTGGTFTRITHLIPIKINIVDNISLDNLIGVNARVRIPLRQSALNSVAARPVTSANNIFARGIVESLQRRNIYTTLGYLIERVYVEVGDHVTEGQMLGVLVAEDLLTDAGIQILEAEASLRMAKINLATVEHNHEILKILYDTRSIPRNELQQSEFLLQSAVATHQQAQALLEATRVAVGQSIIRAPINGTVTAVIAKEGDVGMGRLFVIEDTDNLKIITNVREYDIGKIELGMEVAISSDATGNA